MDDKLKLRIIADEAPFIPPVHDDTTYLVKDPKEPYRRSPTLDAMKGYARDWDEYPANMPCTFRSFEFNPGGAPVETRHPVRLNRVTVHLFPFRWTTPKTTFTHPDRCHELEGAAGLYFSTLADWETNKNTLMQMLMRPYLQYGVPSRSKRI